MSNCQGNRRGYDASGRRRGYTMIEIITSVTLALMIMYAVAKIYSRVGGTMNETMSVMEMNNSLRHAKDQLVSDLENYLSVPTQAPRNSRMNEGYFCYVEGMGAPFDRILAAQNAAQQNGETFNGFATSDVALDTERFEDNQDDSELWLDNTVGDVDDVLSFTVKAPRSTPFQGRYLAPTTDGTDVEMSTFQSDSAEIIWFVRGTTLYRRVLPIMSDELLQDSFKALQAASQRQNGKFQNVAYDNIMRGYGFFYYYDVSVHLDPNGYLVANTLGDLTNRQNRYFYWNSYAEHLTSATNPADTGYPFKLHGANGAWYWLRVATLQESAGPNFRAGAPFGYDASNNGGNAARMLWGDGARNDGATTANYWFGPNQALNFITDGTTPLGSGTFNSNNLPEVGQPFIDFWKYPNVWDEVNWETGDLVINQTDMDQNRGAAEERVFNDDVILTNVLSFNVKVWDEASDAYVDLGCDGANFDAYDETTYDSFLSYGRYGYGTDYTSFTRYDTNGNAHTFNQPLTPCVFDTWSEQYQRDLFNYYDNNSAGILPDPALDGDISEIPSDGEITSSQLKTLPPPYDQAIKSIQIEFRVFDPRSKTIRNATVVVDLSLGGLHAR